MKIFVTGFTASGKTTIGKQLAELLNLPFKDLDAEIEKHTQKRIKDIFETEGEMHFRSIEQEVLQNLISSTELTVIALGGGTMCSKENLSLILRSGISIYLKRTDNFYWMQIPYLIKERPLFAGLSEKEARIKMNHLLSIREPFYGCSQLQTLVTSEFSPKKLANILKLLTNRPQSL